MHIVALISILVVLALLARTTYLLARSVRGLAPRGADRAPASEPALPIIQRAIARRGGGARILIARPLRQGRTGKLHAMIAGMAAAQHDAELVCFADSDTRPAPTLLRDLAAVVGSSSKIGAAF